VHLRDSCISAQIFDLKPEARFMGIDSRFKSEFSTLRRMHVYKGHPRKESLRLCRQESLVHLSKYAVDAGKRLAKSKGDLKNARSFQQIAAGRANLFSEDQLKAAIQVNVLS
jgi:hypothetical protein